LYQVVKFDNEPACRKDFLHLPETLYRKWELTQNRREEEALLAGTHVLSQYFTLDKFIVYSASRACARCIVTTYPDDPAAYIGFFECIRDTECSRTLFNAVHAFLAQKGYRRIVGPVDSSFWIKYRLKVDRFENGPYVSEPYNKPYYLELFTDSGYEIAERYISNAYGRLPLLRYENQKYAGRYERLCSKGYRIVSPGGSEFNDALKAVYSLLMELYRDFPVFKPLSEDAFLEQYRYFAKILDFSMVKIAFFQDEPVGFFVGVPDYKNTLNRKITLLTLINVFFKKLRAGRYVMLYAGVKQGHEGLGGAMLHSLMDTVRRRRATSVGALIKAGNFTGKYADDRIESTYSYVLLSRKLEKIM
jgi:hypothetical protein